ncbi:caprin-2-like [Adelges cooleyi]|uniref:caprin-2-like n=1 Tax=Adelges cooleyi TaxID=133065 RepID=UPI00217F6A23|nr:caprin-2-like [Adelges cooleyi]
MTSNAAVNSNNSNSNGDQQKKAVDPAEQTILVIEHKIRNLEKRKIKLEGYLQQQREGIQLSDDQLVAASKFNEVLSTLEFARNLKKQLNSIYTSSKQKKINVVEEKSEQRPIKFDNIIKEVLIFQNILQNIKDEKVKNDLLLGENGAVQLSETDLLKLVLFAKLTSPKRQVEEGRPLFEDQLKTVTKHYVKLIESKPNRIAGTSYANIRESLLKIENSGYLDQVVKKLDNEIASNNDINNTETNVPQDLSQPTNSIDNVPSNSSTEFIADKIETIYFTNNNLCGNNVEQQPIQSNNVVDPVFNTSFDFLQDSQLEEEHSSENLHSIPTQTFSSSAYNSNRPADEAILKILATPPQTRVPPAAGSYNDTKLNPAENVVNAPSSWVEQPETNWQNRASVVTGDTNSLPRENWPMAQMIANNRSNNDWAIKNNWVQMAEADNLEQQQKQQQQIEQVPKPTPPSQQNTSSNFGVVTNGYQENLNEILQKTVVFSKQEQQQYPVTTSSNNSSFYQNNYSQQPQEQTIGQYNNSNNYERSSHPNDFNKRPAPLRSRTQYSGGEGGGSARGYQQGNTYVYNNRSFKNSNYSNNDYSRTSRQT